MRNQVPAFLCGGEGRGKNLSISHRILAARINPSHGSTSEAFHIFMGRDCRGGSGTAPTAFLEKGRYD